MQIDIAKNIYDKMTSHQLVMSYMGKFDQELLKSLLQLVEKKLVSLSVEDSIRRKILHFVIGCAQNINKMESMMSNTDNCIFLIEKDETNYVIYLGCPLSNMEASYFKTTIDSINELKTEEIKSRFYNELLKSKSNYQNYLLMSLLDISKRTKRKIGYEIVTVNDQNKFLSFKILIEESLKV